MLEKTAKSTVKRTAKRASYDTKDLYPLIDDLKMAHVCFIQEGSPFSIPMLIWRIEDSVYIHGSRGSRLMKQLAKGKDVCLSFAEMNGWVMSKTAFHHSANYRSAVLFGQFEEVTNEQDQLHAYKLFVDQLEEGRWSQIKTPDEHELKATTLLKMNICEGAVKIRTGGPNDDEQDMIYPAWTGEIPLKKTWGAPIKIES
ncbi:pyridoxamine 5'-phosphate oxidase family protein [Litoribacillus peritrichatus]|uniref:Pyridoxamine 5'-phosphate oxidase family protein n=1 Tax=Litoribacillus peritrichatus TaxID=718191 RepID=A0ABP7MRG8_9GAMM